MKLFNRRTWPAVAVVVFFLSLMCLFAVHGEEKLSLQCFMKDCQKWDPADLLSPAN